jgi:hypothetical protein
MLHRCPECRLQVRVDLFNAFYQPVAQGAPGEAVQEQGQAECFYHPGKKAIIPCDACGRLLCALCEVEIGGRHLCVGCLQAGPALQKMDRLKNKHILYDSLALALATWPVLFIFPTLLTGPAAIFVAVRYWKAPSTLVPRTRIRAITAILLGAGQVAGWSFFFIGMLQK